MNAARTKEPFYMPNMMICLIRQQIVQIRSAVANRLIKNGKQV